MLGRPPEVGGKRPHAAVCDFEVVSRVIALGKSSQCDRVCNEENNCTF